MGDDLLDEGEAEAKTLAAARDTSSPQTLHKLPPPGANSLDATKLQCKRDGDQSMGPCMSRRADQARQLVREISRPSNRALCH